MRLSELRKALRSAGEADRLVTRPPGYLLRVRRPNWTRCGSSSSRPKATRRWRAARGTAARRLDEALRLWRGPALDGLDNAPSIRAEAGRLEEERLAVLESRAEALLACGRHRDLVAELETLTGAHPLRERFWLQRMLALYRSGCQADALRAYREVRDILTADLAIEPGPELRDLHARILGQDPALDCPAGGGQAAGPRRRPGGPADQVRPDPRRHPRRLPGARRG